MEENRYLIKNPVLVDDWEGTGLHAVTLYSFNVDSVDYCLVPSSSQENIWCIGFIANVPTSGNPIVADGTPNAQPIVLSNIRGDATVYCDHSTTYDTGYSEINELVYGGKTYYYSGKNLYPMGFDSSDIINNIIPVYTGETFSDYESAALKLIELYKAEGGLMPGEGYPTSWVRKLVGNVWQKTFAFAHAKTVYTDYANCKTLDQHIATKEIQLLANPKADFYRYIRPVFGSNEIYTPPIVVDESEGSFDEHESSEVTGVLHSYAWKSSTIMDILDLENPSGITKDGITVTYRASRTGLGEKLYLVKGTATSDTEIPLYSVSNPKDAPLYFTSNRLSNKMSESTFYVKVSDTSGNLVIMGIDGKVSKKMTTHTGKVTVSLIVKSGTEIRSNHINIKCGYSEMGYVADYSSEKYSDKIDNVADAVLDVKKTANFSHNIPRNVPKDITSYVADGTLWQRLNGTNGFSLFEDIYVGDYIKMSRAITCPNSTDGMTGSQYVTIAGIDTLWGNGDNITMSYHHLVMVPGQGFGGTQHFGRHAMNESNTTVGGYAGSVMNTSVLGAVVSEGSTASGATINQQLYAEFGSHLKTTRELVSISINETGINRFGSATGCSSNWGWGSYQSILLSEVEAYGSIVWSSSGYDTGNAKMQLPLFAHSRNAMNDRSSWYWLKDVASSAHFCNCGNAGSAGYDDAGDAWSFVRPRFVIA